MSNPDFAKKQQCPFRRRRCGFSRGLLGQPLQKFRLLSDHCARVAPQGRKIDHVIMPVCGKGGIGGNAKPLCVRMGSLFMPMVFTFRIFSGRQSLKGDFSGLCVPAWDVVFAQLNSYWLPLSTFQSEGWRPELSMRSHNTNPICVFVIFD